MRHQKPFLLALLWVLFLGISCGVGEEATDEPAGEAATEPAGGATIDESQTGTINGKVNYPGAPEQGARIRMDADPVCNKQHTSPVFSQELEVNDNGTLKNAFVWVKSGLSGYTFTPPSEPVVLDQEGCVYRPHVLGVMTNQEIKITNSDPTTHNIHPIPENNREWNQSQGANAEPLIKSFPREEIMIPIKCNVHPWMKSYVGVVSHPFFAVTGDDGSFSLEGLPAGDYVIEVWHEKLGTTEQQVTLAPQESKEIEFSFSG